MTLALVGVGLGFIAFPTVVAVGAYATVDAVPVWVPYVAWMGNWVWVVGSASGIYLLMLFPDGRPLSPRWRPVVRVGFVFAGAFAVLVAVWPVLEAAPRLDNPFGVEALRGAEDALMVAMLGLPILMLLATISVVLRFVRSTGAERAQMKWVVFAGASLGLLLLAGFVVEPLLPRWTQALPTGMLIVAIVVAVTRSLPAVRDRSHHQPDRHLRRRHTHPHRRVRDRGPRRRHAAPGLDPRGRRPLPATAAPRPDRGRPAVRPLAVRRDADRRELRAAAP